ncbi:MAG: hypothetical protein ACRDQ4_20460 [Pseudonocardiaceae bacterium]
MIPRAPSRAVACGAAVVALAFAAVLVGIGTASAHVETDPGHATQGAEAAFIAFRVPDEETNAGVVKLQVTFPAGTTANPAGQLTTGSATGPDDTARWLGGAGLGTGVLALGLGSGLASRTRRAPVPATDTGTPTPSA